MICAQSTWNLMLVRWNLVHKSRKFQIYWRRIFQNGKTNSLLIGNFVPDLHPLVTRWPNLMLANCKHYCIVSFSIFSPGSWFFSFLVWWTQVCDLCIMLRLQVMLYWFYSSMIFLQFHYLQIAGERWFCKAAELNSHQFKALNIDDLYSSLIHVFLILDLCNPQGSSSTGELSGLSIFAGCTPGPLKAHVFQF